MEVIVPLFLISRLRDLLGGLSLLHHHLAVSDCDRTASRTRLHHGSMATNSSVVADGWLCGLRYSHERNRESHKGKKESLDARHGNFLSCTRWRGEQVKKAS